MGPRDMNTGSAPGTPEGLNTITTQAERVPREGLEPTLPSGKRILSCELESPCGAAGCRAIVGGWLDQS